MGIGEVLNTAIWCMMGWDGMGWDWMGWDGIGWDGTGRDGTGRDGTGRDGMGWDGIGWDGMGWDGMGWDGMGWNAVGWDWMGWDGMGRDGMGWDGMGWDGMRWDAVGWDWLGYDTRCDAILWYDTIRYITTQHATIRYGPWRAAGRSFPPPSFPPTGRARGTGCGTGRSRSCTTRSTASSGRTCQGCPSGVDGCASSTTSGTPPANVTTKRQKYYRHAENY